MYGKIFSSMYEGSMVGAGATVFAVMGYVIAKQQPPDFTVELNSKFLSAVIGETPEAIEKAIEFLCQADSQSRTEKEDGRRLIKVGAFTYHVVNGAHYHSIRNYEERKAYNREAQAKYRAKKNLPPMPELEPQSNHFQKPSIDDLISDGLSPSEASKFWNYYESVGWKVGKKPMKSWKGAVAGWKQRQAQYASQEPQQMNGNSYDMPKGLTKKQEADWVRENCQC